MTFQQKKTKFNLHLKWHTLRSYHFVAELTFKIIN